MELLKGRLANQRIGIRRIAIEKGVRTRAELYQLVDGKVTQINKDMFESGYATLDPQTRNSAFGRRTLKSPWPLSINTFSWLSHSFPLNRAQEKLISPIVFPLDFLLLYTGPLLCEMVAR